MHEMHSLALPAVKDLVYSARFTCCAGVVELVDTTDSKSVAFKSVPVQVRPPVPLSEISSSSPFDKLLTKLKNGNKQVFLSFGKSY